MKPVPTVILAQALAAVLCCGCQPGEVSLYDKLQHERADVRASAIIRAAELGDDKAIPYMVDRLTDKDRSVRFYAIKALEKMTGRTMGYRHYDPPEKRREAVALWRKWLTDRKAPAAPTTPATSEGHYKTKGR